MTRSILNPAVASRLPLGAVPSLQFIAGRLVSVLGLLLFPVAILFGVGMSAEIIEAKLGLGLAAWLLAPITYALGPWYAGFADGQWLPLLINYGAGVIGLPMIVLGKELAGDYMRAELRDTLSALASDPAPASTVK